MSIEKRLRNLKKHKEAGTFPALEKPHERYRLTNVSQNSIFSAFFCIM